MDVDYNLNSDSDEEDEALHPLNNANNRNKGIGNHIHDIEKLKAQTNELLDPTWKDVRNRNLLHKMLELEEPMISPKMVDFLLQDGVCETLVQFITQVGSSRSRPTPSDPRGEELKFAYKAVVLLTPDEPTESLLSILSKKSMMITKAIFDIFRDDSAGSFYHAYRILDTLLRCFPADVYEGIISEGKAVERVTSMLRYIGYPPVHEVFVVLLALTPIARNSQLYNSCARVRWTFLDQMRDWTLMLRIAEIITSPEEHCYLGSHISAECHSTAAAQLMLDLIEKLSLEDTGEALLQPLGYDTSILDKFIHTAVDSEVDEDIRRSACKLLCFLLRRAAEPEILCIVNTAPGNPPQQTSILNRLYPLRERIVLYIETKLPEIFDSLSKYHPSTNLRGEPADIGSANLEVKYSGYSIREPFSSLRASLVELVVLMVESDEAVAVTISVELWRDFMKWTVNYCYNSIYHALFYRLIFAVLRQSQEPAQRILFQKAKLVSFLIENYYPYPVEEKDLPKKDASTEIAHRNAARGVLMNCLNAIRLQATTQPPSSFLRQFLSSHRKWTNFQSTLAHDTDMQQQFGMGITISETKPSNMPNQVYNEARIVEEGGMNHGSRFARSLGFYDDTAWPSDMADPGEGNHDPNLLPKIKKQTKTKKARRRSSSGGTSPHSDIAKLHPEDTHVPWDTSEFVDDFLEVDDDSSNADSENLSDDDGFEERNSFSDESNGDILLASSPTNTSTYLEMNIVGGRPHHVSPIAHSSEDVDEVSTPISK